MSYWAPAAKAKPPAPRPIAPPVQQGNVAIAPPAQPGNVDQNAAALVNQAEMSAQSSIFGQLIETMFTIVEQRFTALIEKRQNFHKTTQCQVFYKNIYLFYLEILNKQSFSINLSS